MLRKKLVFGCVILSLIVTACGGIGGPKTVKIVASLPLDVTEGNGLAWALYNAMQLAVEEAKNKAGNFDVKFEIMSSTEPSNNSISSDKEKANAEKAAADPDVLVFMGSLSSGGCKLSIPALNRAGIAQLSTTATYPGLTKPGFAAGEPGLYYPTGKRTFFRVIPADDMQGPAGGLWAKDLGAKRVYIVKQDDSYGEGLARTFSQVGASSGMTIVGTGVVTSNQTTEVEGIANEIVAQKADLVYHAAFRGSAIAVINALGANAASVRYLATDAVYGPEVIDQLGAKSEGLMVTFSGVSEDELSQAGKDFVSRFKQRFGRDLGSRAYYAVLSYDAMRMALAAIKQAGKADRAAVLDVLRKIEFDGLAGRYSFDENGDTRLMLVTGFTVKDGKWQPKGLLRVR